jgi:hypothetical protein
LEYDEFVGLRVRSERIAVTVINDAVNGERHIPVRPGEPERGCLTLANGERVTRKWLVRANQPPTVAEDRPAAKWMAVQLAGSRARAAEPPRKSMAAKVMRIIADTS